MPKQIDAYTEDINKFQEGIEGLFKEIKKRKYVDNETLRLISLFGKNSMKVGSMITKYNYLKGE